jgi:hypothetical protein
MRIAFALVLLAAAIPGVGMGDALRETGVGAGARSLAIGEGGLPPCPAWKAFTGIRPASWGRRGWSSSWGTRRGWRT